MIEPEKQQQQNSVETVSFRFLNELNMKKKPRMKKYRCAPYIPLTVETKRKNKKK